MRWELPRLQTLGPFRENGPDHFWDHIAGLAHPHSVSRPHILDRHLILVMQRRHLDGGATNEDWVKHRERRGLSFATD